MTVRRLLIVSGALMLLAAAAPAHAGTLVFSSARCADDADMPTRGPPRGPGLRRGAAPGDLGAGVRPLTELCPRRATDRLRADRRPAGRRPPGTHGDRPGWVEPDAAHGGDRRLGAREDELLSRRTDDRDPAHRR